MKLLMEKLLLPDEQDNGLHLDSSFCPELPAGDLDLKSDKIKHKYTDVERGCGDFYCAS